MTTILQHFQVTSDKESDSCPPQLIVVAKRWTNHMEGLLSTFMPCPSIIISVPEEAALYGNVQQVSKNFPVQIRVKQWSQLPFFKYLHKIRVKGKELGAV